MHKYASFFKGEVYEGNEPFAFISYSHKDSREVLSIASELFNNGLRVWFDEGIEAGSEWPEYLAEHLAKSAVVLAFISGHFDESKYCRRELHFASKLNKPIISIYLDDARLSYGLEMELSSIQGFKKSNFPTVDRLIQSIVNVQVIKSLLDVKVESEPINEHVHTVGPIVSGAGSNKPIDTTEVKVANVTDKRSRKFKWIPLIVCLSGLASVASCVFFILGIYSSTNKGDSKLNNTNLGYDSMTSITESVTKEKNSQEINERLKLMPSPGVEFNGIISEEMLIGVYVHLDSELYDKNVAQKTMLQYPDMKFVERVKTPSKGTAFRAAASSVPYYANFCRAIYTYGIEKPDGLDLDNYNLDCMSEWQKLYDDLYKINPSDAKTYYNNYVQLYNSFFVEMRFYTDEGIEASGIYRYRYTIKDNNLNCVRIDLGEKNEIIAYDADEIYKIKYFDNVLNLEAVDGSCISLIPLELSRFINDNCSYFIIRGYLNDPDKSFKNISGIEFFVDPFINGVPSISPYIYFKDGGRTTDVQIEWNSWGNIKLSWYAVYHPDTDKTDAEPDSVLIRIIGLDSITIIDEKNNVYYYNAKTIDAYKDPVRNLSQK